MSSSDYVYERCPKCKVSWMQGEDDPRDVAKNCQRKDCYLKPVKNDKS